MANEEIVYYSTLQHRDKLFSVYEVMITEHECSLLKVLILVRLFLDYLNIVGKKVKILLKPLCFQLFTLLILTFVEIFHRFCTDAFKIICCRFVVGKMFFVKNKWMLCSIISFQYLFVSFFKIRMTGIQSSPRYAV